MSSIIVQYLFNKATCNQLVITAIAQCVKMLYCRLLMKKALTGCSILLALTASISFATADVPTEVAQQIMANLQSAEAHFTFSDSADLAYLTATSDERAVSAQNEAPDAPILESHSSAEKRLAARFAGEFIQADDIVDPSYKPGTPFEGARDVYTFCPQGSDVQRPITLTSSIETNQPEYSWGWSRCSSGDAIRVQDIWVSNSKQGHPLLTLLMVEDGQPGKKTRINLDLNKLGAGKISADDLLKYLK